MNRLSSTYCPSSSDITSCGVLSRFSSTGKERDEETGYGYFGARYMDHELMTMWMSVDPKADKYHGISPYAYCAWNPVKLVDENGCELDIPPIIAAFCSADRQAESFVNSSERKGNFVKNSTSTYDSKGRNIVTVSPRMNIFVDDYDPSQLCGTMLPCVSVTSSKPGQIEFADGGVYHFFQKIGNSLRHFENRLDGGYDGANNGAGCSWEPRNWGFGASATVCIGVGGSIQLGVYCDGNGFWNNYFGLNFCMGGELGMGLGPVYSDGSIEGANSGINISSPLISAGYTNSWNFGGSFGMKYGATMQFGKTWSRMGY